MPAYPRLAVVVALLAALTRVSAGGQAAETKSVSIERLQFQPATLTIKRGETVVWNNADLFAHNVTAERGAFSSGEIGAGGSWKYRATRSGTFPYVCTLHPTMKGTLTVE